MLPEGFIMDSVAFEVIRVAGQEVWVCRGPEEVAVAAAELWVKECARADSERRHSYVALSGGSTPRRTYEHLATLPWRDQVEWDHVELFWGDERCVAPDHRDSNYRMVREALLDHVPVPANHVHRVRTELSPPPAAAKAYEDEIRKHLGRNSGLPQFDLVFLGLGANGHTASLFPQSPVLRETSHLVAADFVTETNSWRITMTAPILNHGRIIAFLVAGQDKAKILQEVLRGPYLPAKLPAQLIKPEGGKLIWIVDQAAASALQDSMEQSGAA